MSIPEFGIGLLGCGTVGAEIARTIERNGDTIAERRGVRLTVRRVGVRDLGRSRPVDPTLVTDDLESIVDDPDCPLIAEAMGGEEPAASLMLRALKLGKGVATANKLAIAKRGPELIDAAIEARQGLRFEAAVCAGVPVVASIAHQLQANSFRRIRGIVNGTTNFILTRMAEQGATFAAALAEAQELGFAEADPSSDVDGWDAAYKISILASLATGQWHDPETVHRTGIRNVSKEDMRAAEALGCRIRLLAGWSDDGGISVEPAFLLPSHPLHDVSSSENAVSIVADPVGELLFRGPGAGGGTTASGVVGDLVELACERAAGCERPPSPWAAARRPKRISAPSRYAILCPMELAAPDAMQKLLQPARIEKVAYSAGEAVGLTEPCESEWIETAMARDQRQRIRTWYRVEG